MRGMKRLPDSELEIMLIIWELDAPATRTQIEMQMARDRIFRRRIWRSWSAIFPGCVSLIGQRERLARTELYSRGVFDCVNEIPKEFRQACAFAAKTVRK